MEKFLNIYKNFRKKKKILLKRKKSLKNKKNVLQELVKWKKKNVKV
jgi:hypothetical protein